MKCQICNRDVPDDPCAIVEAVRNGTKTEVNILKDGKRMAHFGPAEQDAIEAWCHEWAEDNRCNLHWHYISARVADCKPCPFCGAGVKIVDGGYPVQKGEWQPWWLIQCANESCGIWASGPTIDASIKKWNTRVSDLAPAIEGVLSTWEHIECGSREPMSIYLKRPENEMKLFQMVLAVKNLRKKASEYPEFRGNRLDTEDRVRAAEADARGEVYWRKEEGERD